MSLNKAMIIGNLGRDPEMRYTPNGQSVTQFTVAVNRNFRGSDGEWQEETEWFWVVAWGPTGERAAENLRKGVKVYVEGRLRPRADEGDPGFTPPAGRRPVEAAAGSGPAGSASAGPAPAGAPAGRGGDELDQADLDDLPF